MTMEFDADFPIRVRHRAEKYFQEDQFFCSEAVLRAVIDIAAMQEQQHLVTLASGFATGMGGAGCSCGAVVGGIMALGLFFGRSTPGDKQVFACMHLAREMHDSFRQKHGAICCRVLNKGVQQGSPEQEAKCAQRSADAAEIAATIIMREMKKRS